MIAIFYGPGVFRRISGIFCGSAWFCQGIGPLTIAHFAGERGWQGRALHITRASDPGDNNREAVNI
jgi:hypothetical protein